MKPQEKFLDTLRAFRRTKTRNTHETPGNHKARSGVTPTKSPLLFETELVEQLGSAYEWARRAQPVLWWPPPRFERGR